MVNKVLEKIQVLNYLPKSLCEGGRLEFCVRTVLLHMVIQYVFTWFNTTAHMSSRGRKKCKNWMYIDK